VEDSAPNRKLLMSLLVVLKCRPSGAEDGQQCVDMFPSDLLSDEQLAEHQRMALPLLGPKVGEQEQAQSALSKAASPSLNTLSATAMLPFDCILMGEAHAQLCGESVSRRASCLTRGTLLGVCVCVCVDGTMPVMNGVTATRVLRDRGYWMPIIAVTGKSVQQVKLTRS
jgi:CheY-like chemotaxis protein